MLSKLEKWQGVKNEGTMKVKKKRYRCITVNLNHAKQATFCELFMLFVSCFVFLFYVNTVSEVLSVQFLLFPLVRESQNSKKERSRRNDNRESSEHFYNWGLSAIAFDLHNIDVQSEVHEYLFILIFFLRTCPQIHCSYFRL